MRQPRVCLVSASDLKGSHINKSKTPAPKGGGCPLRMHPRGIPPRHPLRGRSRGCPPQQGMPPAAGDAPRSKAGIFFRNRHIPELAGCLQSIFCLHSGKVAISILKTSRHRVKGAAAGTRILHKFDSPLLNLYKSSFRNMFNKKIKVNNQSGTNRKFVTRSLRTGTYFVYYINLLVPEQIFSYYIKRKKKNSVNTLFVI